ncbi:MAG: glycosyltransferase family 4 protein, partial [Acidobacteria bacterium]|nr:glycosyltransferase family 4 protein [Acidobacteriota bacterium]
GFPGFDLNLRPHVDARDSVRSRLAFPLMGLPTLVSLLLLIAKHRIDAVNVHYPSAQFSYFALCRRVSRIKLIVSIHGTDVLPCATMAPRLDLLTRALINAADAVVSPSAGFGLQCLPALGQAASRLTVIHNGVDRTEFVAAAQPRDPATVLTIASLDPWKGIHVLLRAIAVVRQHVPQIRLKIAGAGPEWAQLTALTASLGLGDCVEFLGYQDRASVRQLLSTCSVFVLPSLSEPFGIVVLEALAAGAPIVASRVGGIPELVKHRVHGLLVTPGDEQELAAAITLSLRDRDLRGRLVRAGTEQVRTGFSWGKTAVAYERLFTRLVGAPQSRFAGEPRDTHQLTATPPGAVTSDPEGQPGTEVSTRALPVEVARSPYSGQTESR